MNTWKKEPQISTQ